MDLALATRLLRPCPHDMGIVDGDDGDVVNAAGKEGVAVFEIAGKMGQGTGAGEGAGHAEQDDLPALEERLGGDFADAVRSEERRVGKACVRTCRSRWSPYH